jgi:hypothetical protein
MEIRCKECGAYVGDVLNEELMVSSDGHTICPIKSVCFDCEQNKTVPEWPKKVKALISSMGDSMWEHGVRVGLQGLALEKFSHALDNVEVWLDVSKDGTYKIVGIKEHSY